LKHLNTTVATYVLRYFETFETWFWNTSKKTPENT
jgi:hypothetical protein